MKKLKFFFATFLIAFFILSFFNLNSLIDRFTDRGKIKKSEKSLDISLDISRQAINEAFNPGGDLSFVAIQSSDSNCVELTIAMLKLFRNDFWEIESSDMSEKLKRECINEARAKIKSAKSTFGMIFRRHPNPKVQLACMNLGTSADYSSNVLDCYESYLTNASRGPIFIFSPLLASLPTPHFTDTELIALAIIVILIVCIGCYVSGKLSVLG